MLRAYAMPTRSVLFGRLPLSLSRTLVNDWTGVRMGGFLAYCFVPATPRPDPAKDQCFTLCAWVAVQTESEAFREAAMGAYIGKSINS